jgi:predicted enzyme related to lactoylglutathione lyase
VHRLAGGKDGCRSCRLLTTCLRTFSYLVNKSKAMLMQKVSSRGFLLSGIALAAALAVQHLAIAAPVKSAVLAVGVQYDTAHVYVVPDQVDHFVDSFVATFGGQSTKQVVATVTPTPSSTTSQLVQTPVGTISVFGFKTPIPYPFGAERTGYLVTDLDKALVEARHAGADVLVDAFPDPIGRDAVIQWPGGINMQLYWHTTPPTYAAFEHVPENRVYVSPDRATAFVHDFVAFSQGKVVSDVKSAPGSGIGDPSTTYRRIRIESKFGKMAVLVTTGHLVYPYGRETTGYEVDDLPTTLAKAQAASCKVIVAPFDDGDRSSAVVEFPGGYVAEIHSAKPTSSSGAAGVANAHIASTTH